MIYGDIGLIVFEIVFAIFLLWLNGYSRKAPNSKWRLCYAVPIIVAINAVGIFGFEISMTGVYVGAAILLYGFFENIERKRYLSGVVAIVCVLFSVLVCLFYSGYRAPDYEEDFKKGFKEMKKHYVLSEHKGIHWDELYEEYLPKFQEANEKHSAVDNVILWQKFCQEFYDGHVSFMSNADESAINKADSRVFGNDYGLSMMRLSSGEFVAVNVESGSEAANAGVHNGTVILEWDKKSPQEYFEDITMMTSAQPDEENRQFYLPVYVAGIGGETVEIKFISDSGEDNNVTVHKNGAYIKRLEKTIKRLDCGVEAGNLSFMPAGEHTALLRITEMMYDSESYNGTDYSAMKDELRIKIMELRQQGISNIIIDLRNNCGGSPHMIMGIASLFAPEGEHSYGCVAQFDEKNASYKVDEATGKYVVDGALSYYGENLWSDGNIVILVNAECISAGDHLVLAMSEFENVTVMGFTKSNGSGQAVNSVILESGALTYSSIPLIDAEGNILIDSGVDHLAGVALDVKIPFDEKAVRALFDNEEDYALQYAVEYLEGVDLEN